jgi:cyanate permease
LFWIVGAALWGLPFFYDFMVQQFGWTRAQVTSGNALGYVCGGPLPNQVLLTRWFDRSRGEAMGVAYLGIEIGGAAVPWMSHALVRHFGWQAALRKLGLSIAVISFPLAALLKEPPGARTATSAVELASPKSAFRKGSFYLLALGSMCSIAAVSGTQQNLKLFLSLDRHFTQTDAAGLLSLVLAFSIAGRLLMGWLADRFSKKYVLLLTYLLVATGILGGDYMMVPLMTAEIFGIEILGRLLGVIVIAGGIAEAAAPWAVSRLRDVTGSYASPCFTLVGVALMGALLGLPERRRVA